ncbi:phage tail protein [Serratia ureilytica]|uniref:phage tail protein n=1 Tax=Serratia ureilytica TaxID=300181 RepID=UPI0019D01F2A|nr:hypothetical protein [Serratia ureilytica]MBN5372049.1 hypothetical protein [Serratia ureilytica]HEI9850100.1 hypothetical protein [Serratia marcescens]
MDEQKLTITLPTWLNRGEVKKLAAAAGKFWEKVRGWISWPLQQTDPLTCTVQILNLLAYQRDITRFDGEPLGLFRKRVKYAFLNAQDSGSLAGFRNIFLRLGIGEIGQAERQPGIDWDVIIIRLNDSQLASNAALMQEIIRQYGRTCRRYQFQVVNTADAAVRAGQFDNDHQLIAAQPGIDPVIMTEDPFNLLTEDGYYLTV